MYLPWKQARLTGPADVNGGGGGGGGGGVNGDDEAEVEAVAVAVAVAAPLEIRLASEAWCCSHRFHILDHDMVS